MARDTGQDATARLLSPVAVVLRLPINDRTRLAPLVEACLTQGCSLFAIWGEGAAVVEDIVDTIIIGEGTKPERFMTTTAHGPEDDAVEFAMMWNGGNSATVLTI